MAGSSRARWIWAALAATFATLTVWGWLAGYPWDDDCVRRYFNAQHALEDPAQFVSVWNRPLAILYLVLPAQAGRLGVVVAMALLSTATCAVLYRARVEAGAGHPGMILPLAALQPFFFATGYSALSEPLAAFVIALGYLFYVRRHPLGLALCGGWLPLARLELAPLLVFWLIPLVRWRAWRSLPLLAVPVLLWNVGGWILHGDPAWVYNQTLGADPGVNRYGQTRFAHYFERLPFVVGPVVFYFTIVALANLIVRRSASLFVLGQLVTGFLIYVVFSWKLSLGQAYGFLRHLVALAPLFAVLAHHGYLAWIDADPPRRRWWATLAGGLAATILTALFFSIRLVDHHALQYEPEYAKLAICAVLLLVHAAVLGRARPRPLPVQIAAAALVTALAAGYTLSTEPPEKTYSDERRAMRMIADAYLEAGFSGRPTLVNHIAFFHATDLSPFEEHFRPLTRENLRRLPPGGIVIWENHYSQRLVGDVMIEDIRDRPGFARIGRVRTPDGKLTAYIFQRTAGP